MSFFDKVKRAGKTIVDSGSKTMLKTDVVFLEREIKSRKQRFGVEVYELMEQLEIDTDLTIDEKESKIRLAFDRARKDIAVIQAKIECKREEMGFLMGQNGDMSGATDGTEYPMATNVGTVQNHVMTTSHPSDSTEMEHGITQI